MKMINCGRKISRDDINNIQEKIGVIFPEDYCKFLLQSNGGETEEDMLYDFFDEVTENNNRSAIQEFFSIDGEMMDIYTVYKNLLDEEAIPRDMIAIASDPGGNIISISLSREDYGTVYFLNHAYGSMGGARNLFSLYPIMQHPYYPEKLALSNPVTREPVSAPDISAYRNAQNPDIS